MSDRLSLWEIRRGTYDDWVHLCFCTDESQANALLEHFKLQPIHILNEIAGMGVESPTELYVMHVEIVVNTDIDIQEY